MAERYPDDFNGIIAGAPEIIAGPLNAEIPDLAVPRQHRRERQRDPDRAQLPTLHQTVIDQCQGDDGVAGDGIITDPRSCTRTDLQGCSARRRSRRPA